jgi:hypothetical protein
MVTPRTGRFATGKETCSYFTKFWVGLWVDLKISPTPGFDPQTVQPVAIRHTDYAIPGENMYLYRP